MVQDTELEEGGARFDDIDANIDPDTALSYIDDRLQYVLGHFRKDFDYGVSAEILGPKFGGYGSFLPAHKHSPIVHSHGNPLNFNKLSSPNNFHLEGAPVQLNPVTLVDPVKPAALNHKDVSVDQNVVSVDDIATKDASLMHGETLPSKNETNAGNSVNPTEQRSLKVRIKVGSYNPAMKKNEIYGGLGLLTPSSSTSNNPEDSGDLRIKSHDIPFDSPRSILRDMGSIFVPGNRLLSPLTESLICLKKLLINEITVKPSSGSVTSEANRAAEKDARLKMRKTKKELIKDQLFGPDFTSKESDESYEQKNVNKLSLDSRGIRLIACKNDPSVIKHETDFIENKVGREAISLEPHEVNITNNMTNTPLKRKNKLTGVHRKENLKDKKSALKDIVKVRDSYKEILDLDNGAIKVENVEKHAIPAEVAVSLQTVVGPAAPPDNWVGCDRCEKWRLLPIGIEPDNLPDKWLCNMTTWLPGRNHCNISEDETTRAVQEMNLQLISQNQDNLQFNGTRGNMGNSETIANKFEKMKSRPPEGTNASLDETSHVSMDVQQHNRQKRKSLSENNQLLFKKKGDVKPIKLKNKTESEEYETVTSKKIKIENELLNSSNGGHRPKDGLVISLKTQTESKILDKKVEIHAKKRKLKDWQESQPHENGLENSENRIQRKEKRMKKEVKEFSDEKCLTKGKTMKIKLPASKENSADTNHEKSCQKDMESERFLVAATSSSSVVSGSCKRASLQERKVSPVGSVLSFPIRPPNLDKNSLAVEETISRKHLVRTEDLRKVKASDPLTGQLNKTRRVEEDVSGNIVGKKHAGSEAKFCYISSQETISTVKKSLKKDFVNLNEVEQVQAFDRSGQNQSKVAANQNVKSLVTDCGTLKDLSVISFLKEFASSQSQTALTAIKRAEESKDYADRLKISGFDYECNNVYFDSALKFLCAASLMEACTADISKSKGVDAINVYNTSAKLSKICALEYEKRKEMLPSALAYKCMEVACMRIVYCKNLQTRQDLTSTQIVTQGESPSSSASDVDNLNNQSTMDKTMLYKSITHHKNDVRNQTNLTKLLDFTSDVSLAMEASMKSRDAFKSASAILEEASNKETIIRVKRVVNFSFQDVKEFTCLVQNAREAVNRQGNKRQ